MAALLACMYGTRPVHGQLDPQEDAGALPMAFEAVDRRFKHAPKDVRDVKDAHNTACMHARSPHAKCNRIPISISMRCLLAGW